MKITSRIIPLILISSFILGGIQIAQPATATVKLNSFGPVPGDTVWYTVDTFYMDLEFLSQGEINDTYMTTTLDLSGSQLFAKVMDVFPVDGYREDPVSGASNPATTNAVDLAVGAILGTDLPFRYENFSTTVPAGVGVPLPTIFLSYTEFGFSSDEYPGGFFPLFLSDDWATHEAFVSAQTDMVVTNDAAQFKVEGVFPVTQWDNENYVERQTAEASVSLAWDKSNNALSSAVYTVTNATLGETYLDIKINFDKIENIGLDLEVDDRFEFTITQGTLDMSFTGDFDNPDVKNGYGNATEALANATAVDVLVEMTVNKVQGLYYLVTVRQWNDTLGAMEVVDDMWFAGFGRIDFRYFKNGGPNLLYQEVMTGPAVTPDNYIWGSWDASISYLFAAMEQSFDTLVESVKDSMLNDDTITSFNVVADLSLSHTVDTTNGYNFTSSSIIQINTEVNQTMKQWVDFYYDNETGTYVDVYEYYWQYVKMDISLNTESTISYDSRGRLSTISVSASGYFDLSVQTNSTTMNSGSGRITLNQFTLVIDSQFTPATPETDTPANTNASSVTTPPNPLPGFEFFVAAISLTLLVVVVRKREY